MYTVRAAVGYTIDSNIYGYTWFVAIIPGALTFIHVHCTSNHTPTYLNLSRPFIITIMM